MGRDIGPVEFGRREVGDRGFVNRVGLKMLTFRVMLLPCEIRIACCQRDVVGGEAARQAGLSRITFATQAQNSK